MRVRRREEEEGGGGKRKRLSEGVSEGERYSRKSRQRK